MGISYRVLVETYDTENQQVMKQEAVFEEEVKSPGSLWEVGLNQLQQVTILKNLVDAYLSIQAGFVNVYQSCPSCQGKVGKNGWEDCSFHSVYTDHRLSLQRYKCLLCKWKSQNSFLSLYGSDLHPDLWKLQTAIGSSVSYQKGEYLLDQMCGQRRKVNNDVRIQRLTQALGTEIADWDQGISDSLSVPLAKELYLHVDGGHVSHREREKRSFEAMIGIVYRPESVKRIDKNHCTIIDKRCVASCLDDHQEKIKAYLKKAAQEQGMTKETHMTAFADGASNCWSVINSLKPYCGLSRICCGVEVSVDKV